MIRLRFHAGFLLLASAGPLVGQQVWHVDCNGGPGSHFTDLPQAVAAAAPGDTILVYYDQPWCQTLYTAPTITKPLRIQGFQVITTTPPPIGTPTTPSKAALSGIVTISGIASGQQVVLSNLGLPQWPPYVPGGLQISDCDGSVLLEDIYFNSAGMIGSVLSIMRCQDVVLRDNEYRLGGVPLSIVDSTVLLSTCLFTHTAPFPLSPPGYTNITSALNLRNSNVTIVGSVLSGLTFNPSMGPFAPAAWLDSSTLRVGPATFMRGANTSVSGQYTQAYLSVNPATCQVHIDPRASVVYSGVGAQPAPITTEIDAAYHSRIVAAYAYGLSVAGPANGFALMLLGNLTPLPTPTPFGQTVLDPLTIQVVDLVYLPPPYGIFSWNLVCPATAPNAFPFVFQALTLSPVGQFGITVPSPLTVGWQHGRIP